MRGAGVGLQKVLQQRMLLFQCRQLIHLFADLLPLIRFASVVPEIKPHHRSAARNDHHPQGNGEQGDEAKSLARHFRAWRALETNQAFVGLSPGRFAGPFLLFGRWRNGRQFQGRCNIVFDFKTFHQHVHQRLLDLVCFGREGRFRWSHHPKR